jgi:hypothetical protein
MLVTELSEDNLIGLYLVIQFNYIYIDGGNSAFYLVHLANGN